MIRNNRIKVMFFVTILTLLISTACTTNTSFEEPLAPTMELATEMIEADLALETAALPESNAIPGVELELPTNTPEMEKTCGESGSKTIIFVGSDVLGSAKPNGADSIRLIKVNFDTQTVKIVTFPRDMLVYTSSLNEESKEQQPLGLTYFTAFEAAMGTPLEKNAVGAGVVAQLLRENFGVEPTLYVTVQMDKFGAMVDTVGGIEITLPAAITTEHNISFPAGKQTLNGALATEYVRFLNPGGESARTARQNEVVNALQAKMINVNILPQIPTLIAQFKDAFITDLSAEQLTNLACLALTMPKENISFGAITSPDMLNNNVPNNEKIKSYLETFLK